MKAVASIKCDIRIHTRVHGEVGRAACVGGGVCGWRRVWVAACVGGGLPHRDKCRHTDGEVDGWRRWWAGWFMVGLGGWWCGRGGWWCGQGG